MFFESGLPPFAFEWCLQSGEAHRSPIGRPGRTLSGSTCQMLELRCSVSGWFAACMASASASWLIATSGERPSAISIPSDAPPPPANESTMISLPLAREAGEGQPPKAAG